MEKDKRPDIELYSDGASENNPGASGYGVILRCPSLNYEKEFSQGYEISTNNRMELLGVISGLEKLKNPSNVSVFTDSKYVAEAMQQGWFERWKDNNWKRNPKEKVANVDLWKRLEPLLEQHNVTFNWVKGHNGHPENERCDRLAVEASKNSPKLVDTGYDPNENLHIKVEKEGDLCRHCDTPVIKVMRNLGERPKKETYYEWWFKCPNCKALYMVEEAKRNSSEWKDTSQQQLDLF